MIKQYMYGLVLCACLGLFVVPQAHAETTTTDSSASTSQIQMLLAKIAELQKQLVALQGEVKTTLKAQNFSEGTSGADVTKIQQLLATDPEIYPEGNVTGFFGPRTKAAVMRFQKKHGLPETGVVASDTRAIFEDYIKEGGDHGKIPPGLLRAPGIMKKMETKMMKWDCKKDAATSTATCRPHMEHGSSTKDHEGDDDHEHMMDHHGDKHGSSTPEKGKDAGVVAANEAIKAARALIEKAGDKLESATGNVNDSQDKLFQARQKLIDARRALLADNTQDAIDLANQAKQMAQDVLDSL